MMLARTRGQGVLEYVVIIAAVAAALILMKTYIKRGVQGHFQGIASKIAGESEVSYDRLFFHPELLRPSKLSAEDFDFASDKILGDDYVYSAKATISYISKTTGIKEQSRVQAGDVTTNNQTEKNTQKQETVFTDWEGF